VALLLTGGAPVTVPALVTTSLWFTLASFLGLLVLPTPSRAGVHEADLAVRDSTAPEVLDRLLVRLDRLQDDEPSRSRAVETIFHPVPSVASRRRRLREGRRVRGCWHAARMALPLSWAGLGLLGRAVHCNCGRPALWVMLPGD
jgi:Zn-dependent protease with chaperone function